MNELKLFHVNIIEEWSTEAEAFVLAASKDDAEHVAKRNVKIDLYGAEHESTTVRATEASFTFLDKLGNKDFFYFFAPAKSGLYSNVDYETFKSFISPDELERIRIKTIEKDNGQLPLLE
jgi:hypothetical protein